MGWGWAGGRGSLCYANDRFDALISLLRSISDRRISTFLTREEHPGWEEERIVGIAT